MKPPNRTKYLMLRLTPKEHRDLLKTARGAGQTVAGWVRALIYKGMAK